MAMRWRASWAITPIYLHYNSGLSVSTNGRILAQLMERLFDAWPVPIERLALLGHSMGGLVARSALHHSALIPRGGPRWPARVDDLVCLGTPHQGAPLERAGHGVDLLLSAAPYAAPLARLGKLRSAGINDMRLGNIVSGPAGDDGTHQCAQVSLPDDDTLLPPSLGAWARPRAASRLSCWAMAWCRWPARWVGTTSLIGAWPLPRTAKRWCTRRTTSICWRAPRCRTLLRQWLG